LLAIRDLSADDLQAILALSEAPAPRVLQDQGVALYFEKPSTRTRNSMELAAAQLCGHPVYLQPAELGIGTRESVEDVTRTLACYHAIIAARVFDHALLEQMAALNAVSVLNMLSATDHPLQALADEDCDRKRAALVPYQVNETLMAHAPNARFLHCLPAHRGEEVTAGVIDGPRSAVWRQAENRMHSARGAMLWMLS